MISAFFFQAEDGIRDYKVTGVQTCALPISFPVLKNPANRHKAVGFTHEQWHYAFTNTFDEEESRRLYERYHVPEIGRASCREKGYVSVVAVDGSIRKKDRGQT